MDKQNDMAQLRYLEEAAISLKRAGFDTGQIEDRHLPVSWNGSYLCRISGKGSVLYRQQNVDANGAQAELQNVIDIAKTISEYMAMMERAPQLKARDLEGDYLTAFDLNVQRQNMARQEKPLVGRVTFVNGNTQEFTDVEAYLRCIEDELPDRPITGFRYETLTDDPAVRKGVDDILFNIFGEENPCRLEDYETPNQGMKMGGIGT